jgi:carboxyl-terminal processing protease
MKIFLLAILSFIIINISEAQTLTTAANDAYVITRMAEKFHVQPKPLDDQFSHDVFNEFLKQLDDERIFFTQEDISKLQPFYSEIDDEVKQRKTDLLFIVISLYQLRVQQADTMITGICKLPFNFSLPEKLTVSEDTSYPANVTVMRVKLYKKIKLDMLSALIETSEAHAKEGKPLSKTQIDSLEIVLRKKVQTSFKRAITAFTQAPGGIQQAVANVYCKTIASWYDPHTEYFPLTEKENFESELGNHAYEFGFSLDDGDDGGVVINTLKPGSPDYRSGLLNKGDKLITLQWEGKQPIDVSDADQDEVAGIIDESNHDKITFTVKKADGSVKQVTLQKEMATDDDEENKVKSFLLKGTKTIGYISLPAFYSDWQDEASDVNGCANDVSKEILKLEKENINGLIIDLRYNGGGSMEEAVALSGIFIDAGPVEQIKSRDEKVYSLKDANRGVIYSGPLLLMVNGYSASASEMVAGTLQDYNRAIIFGSATYGKATSQIVLPMDTTINLENENSLNKRTSSFIKITTDRLYRITGQTAQGKGVQPDVMLPDILETSKDREANETFMLTSPNIDANKYYHPYPPMDLAPAKALAEKELNGDNYFATLEKYIAAYNARHNDRDHSLKWDDALGEKKDLDNLHDEIKDDKDSLALDFSIENNAYEKQRLQNDETLKETNDELKDYLSKDHYLKIAYDVLSLAAK